MNVNGPIIIPLYDFKIIIYNNELSINISFLRLHIYVLEHLSFRYLF